MTDPRLPADAPTPRYFLRTCAADMTSRGGFVWPTSGLVRAPDWCDDDRCGGGLHGLRDGEGDGSLIDWSGDARWIVYSAHVWRDIEQGGGGKAKSPEAQVLHVGDRLSATDFLQSLGCHGAIVGCYKTGGYRSTLTGGDESTLTGGYRSTLTGGDGSTLTGGYRSTLTGGYGSTLTGGYGSTLTGGDGSTLTGGDGSTLTGGDGSTLTGGNRSTLIFRWWNATARRMRSTVAYVGEDGVQPDVAYTLRDIRALSSHAD